MAAAKQIRGADSVYVALAEEFGATLITWDQEMLQRSGTVVPVQTPEQWLQTRFSGDASSPGSGPLGAEPV